MTSLASNIPPELYEILLRQQSQKLPKRCLICGNHPFMIGLFNKLETKRMLVYCLCVDCYKNPESEEIVEKIIRHYEDVIQPS